MKRIIRCYLFALLISSLSTPSYAAQNGAPWEGRQGTVINIFQGSDDVTIIAVQVDEDWGPQFFPVRRNLLFQKNDRVQLIGHTIIHPPVIEVQ